MQIAFWVLLLHKLSELSRRTKKSLKSRPKPGVKRASKSGANDPILNVGAAQSTDLTPAVNWIICLLQNFQPGRRFLEHSDTLFNSPGVRWHWFRRIKVCCPVREGPAGIGKARLFPWAARDRARTARASSAATSCELGPRSCWSRLSFNIHVMRVICVSGDVFLMGTKCTEIHGFDE